jgi:hypothetical protein
MVFPYFRDSEERGVEWSFVIHDEEGYLEVITRGLADRDNSLNMAKAIAHTMRAHRIKKAVIDHRNLEVVAGTILDIYKRPRMFWLIGAILGIRIAEIIKPEHFEHFRFLETVCQNEGHQMSIFLDKDKALAWLLWGI